MNLRIADWPELVAFLHGVVSKAGETVLAMEGVEVVEVDGCLWFHGSDPIMVGGAFRSLEALVRSEGVRRYPLRWDDPDRDPPVEVVEWQGAFFRIEAAEAGEPKRYGDLESAVGR
jgi:hypothetical protein